MDSIESRNFFIIFGLALGALSAAIAALAVYIQFDGNPGNNPGVPVLIGVALTLGAISAGALSGTRH